jgi:hypothetical protein
LASLGLGYEGCRVLRNEPLRNDMQYRRPSIVSFQDSKLKANGLNPPKDANYTYAIHVELGDNGIESLVLGTYNPDTNTISLDTTRLVAQDGLEAQLIRFLNKLYLRHVSNSPNKTLYTADRTIAHERGHQRADELAEQNLQVNWPDFVPISSGDLSDAKGQRKIDSNLAKKIVSEGFGRYFERVVYGGKDLFKDSEYPKNINELRLNMLNYPTSLKYLVHEGGYHLVKPIIDKYKEKGMLYMIENPPIQYLTNLPEYQKIVMKALADQEAKEKKAAKKPSKDSKNQKAKSEAEIKGKRNLDRSRSPPRNSKTYLPRRY